MRVRGEPGHRIWETSDRKDRHYEDEGAEQCRQARFARSKLGPDGEHYVPESNRSLEGDERSENEILWSPRPKPTKPKRIGVLHDIWTAIFAAGMYSSDPQIARIGEIQTIKRQVIPAMQGNRAEDQQMAAQQRADDLANEERRMEMLGASIARNIVIELEKQRVK